MMNLGQKVSGTEDLKEIATSEAEEFKRSCADCHTTKTPLWRGGPAGPRSLCNACGIRQRKKRRALLGLNNDEAGKSKKSRSNKSSKPGVSIKLRLMAWGKEIVLHRSSGFEKKDQLGEEEQAAMLLMALSCGSSFCS